MAGCLHVYKWRCEVIQMAFQSHIQQIELMERPFLLQLQYLLNKFAESAALTPTDVGVLDRCHSAMASTEVANTANQIYLLIAESNNERFFACFETVISNAADPLTRSLMLSLLSTRLRKEWRRFEQCYKDGLKQYVISQIRKNLEEEGDQSVLLHLNQVLVGMLRFEWDSLFKDFVSNMEAAGTDLPLGVLLNNLTILRLLLEEGFSTMEELVSPYEFQRFRDSLQQDMRCVLKLLCQCLQSDGKDRPTKVRKCLDTLRLAVDNISAFELFNCNLIELLVGLIGNQEFRRPLVDCFQAIFRFKETTTRNNSHSKIAEKLLLILESYLAQYEDQHRVDYFSDKETVSTEDSFHSRRTRKIKERKPDYSDLLGLLYQFLTRYVPFMDKAKGEQDLEIEFETNIKLYFSQDLYEAFGLIYWRLVQFIMHIAEHFDALIYVENDQDSLEEKRRVVCCLRLMLAMHSKLKLEVRAEIKSMIEVCIVNFAPLSEQFSSFYIHYSLLKNGSQDITEKPLVSTDLQEEFLEFMRTILSEKATCRLFAELIYQNIECYDEVQSIQKDRKKIPWEMNKDIEKYETLRAINVINRMSWSLVFAYRCNPTAIKSISIFNLSQALTKATQFQGYQDLQRCYSLNSKFILQVYYPDNNNAPVIMNSLNNCSEFVAEFLLVILSKMLMADSAHLRVDFKDLERIIEKLHELEVLDVVQKDRIVKLYPAIVRVLIGKMEMIANKPQVKKVLDDMISKEITNLKGFSLNDETRDQPELRWAIYLFKRLIEISYLLEQEFKSSKPPRHALAIVNEARRLIQAVIVLFQFKHKHFGKHLRQTNKENFDMLHLIEFRKHYIQLSRCYVALITVAVCSERASRTSKQNKDSTLIITLEQGEREDFISQNQFKQKEYLPFALEFYNWALVNCVDSCDELINDSISAIVECLHSWEGDSDIQKEKYVFWKEVVRMFALKLNRKNREHLVHLYGDFELKNILSGSIEAIIEVYHQLMGVLHEQCIRGGKPLKFPEFTSLFITTFETLFSSSAKHMPIFDRLTYLFFCQIDFLTSLSSPLEPNSKKDNNQIAFILICSHICKHLPLQSNEQHHSKLVNVFRERKYPRWQAEIKDYVVFVSRVCEESQNQRA